MKYWLTAILLGISSTTSVHAQSPPALRGTVLSVSDKPLVGIHLYGNYWRECCPAQFDQATTDETGSFTLPHQTDFVRIRDQNFGPATILVTPGQSDLRIVLGNGSTTTWNVPTCPVEKERGHRLGTTLAFLVARDAKTRKVQDADYVAYYVSHGHNHSQLRLMFGPTVGGTDPDDRLERNSSQFSERWINGPMVGLFAIDATGRAANGKLWRHSGTFDGLAEYSDATEDDAEYFDTIIDTACITRVAVDLMSTGQKK